MIELPGLRGDDPLGFLAAVGLLSLSEQRELPELRLAWQGGRAPVATVEGEVHSVEELGRELRAAFDRLRERDAVIPGAPPDLPRKKTGVEGSDPMRMGRGEMRALYAEADTSWLKERTPWVARWLIALTAHATLKNPNDNKKAPHVELTPFYAPAGQMTMRTSIFEKTMDAVEAVGGPGDALTGWRRAPYDGANFDERAKRDAGTTTFGQPDNRGAPSPTWLAAMAMRFFPMTDDGAGTATVGWQRVRLYAGYTTRSLIWPIWRPFLDPVAVRTLLAHPGMRLEVPPRNDPVPARLQELSALGVAYLFGASRRTLAQGDGPLGPARLIWAASPAQTW
jgi:hypothetical protein